ncbi:MAG: DNA cytosine methyltransferase, partial [Thiobacillus sp.]
ETALLAFSCKDYGADAGHIAPTLRAMGHSGSHANAGGQVAVCVTGDIAHTLKAEWFDASEDGTGRGQPIISVTGESYASTKEADATKALRALREAVGKEAFTQWGLGVLDSLQGTEVLRQKMHGCSVRCQACEGKSQLDDSASSRPQAGAVRTVCAMREAGRERRTPQGRQLAEQCARELGAHLSELPHSGASPKGFLHGMWQASEGVGLLREALSALQEVGRPIVDQGEPALPASAVRRLTPKEAERLQGFPDGYTLVPYRNKEAADGPRYTALGNSMAVPVMAWIGRRILMALGTAMQEAA